MFGPSILARSLSVPGRTGWQYHSRSDRHSKIACWAILFDVMHTSELIRKQASSRKLSFGINHEMQDFAQDRKKNLDLVLCTPRADAAPASARTFAELVDGHGIVLTRTQQAALARLPELREAPVGAVRLALEAKAAMTAHVKALPRLHDELVSSHETIHGHSDQAIAAGYVLVNLAKEYRNPTSEGKVVVHRQPRDAERVVEKVRQLKRRAKVGDKGFDALGVTLLSLANDGTPVRVVTEFPAPQPGENFHYDTMIHRIADAYASRWPHL